MDRANANIARDVRQSQNARSPSIDGRGNGKRLHALPQQVMDRQRMNRTLPPLVLLPARGPLFRAAERAGTIEDHSPAQARQFTFRAVRTEDCADLGQAGPQSSASFLAGAIAQARPSAMLQRYREAAGAYRRSDRLGIDTNTTAHRSDKTV
jgi:hypothetical protein